MELWRGNESIFRNGNAKIRAEVVIQDLFAARVLELILMATTTEGVRLTVSFAKMCRCKYCMWVQTGLR